MFYSPSLGVHTYFIERRGSLMYGIRWYHLLTTNLPSSEGP